MVKSELELRLEELETAMSKAEPGSALYGSLVADYDRLSRLKIAQDDQTIGWSRKKDEIELERIKTDNLHEENMAKVEIESKARGWKRSLLEIGLGTLAPFGLYMLWESSGHVVSGKAVQWIGKIKK